MKSKIIAALSGVTALVLIALSIVQMAAGNSKTSIWLMVLSLVAMYFLYTALVLRKYDKGGKASSKDKNKAGKQRDEKHSKDYGKVLEFPKDKRKKDDK